MIKTENLKKNYNKVTVLDLPDLTVTKGESFGLVGNNGAGKTTFFRLLLDLIKANDGFITSNSVDVTDSTEWKNYTGSYLDENFLIDYLTPEEYFDFLGDLHKMSKNEVKEFLSKFDDFFNGEIIGKKKYIRDLSKGNKQKVGVVGALVGNPEVLVLDEPFANIDPSTQFKLKNLLRDLQLEAGITMLISSHDLNHITDVCDRIAILESGKIVHDIKTDEETLKELKSYFAIQ